jgi:hypothetical protein
MIDLSRAPEVSKRSQKRVAWALRDSLGLKKHLGTLSLDEVGYAIHAELAGQHRRMFLLALGDRYAALDATATRVAITRLAFED